MRERSVPDSPVVFVHGLIGTLRDPDLLAYFPRGRAIAPDLLGYGSLRHMPSAELHVEAQVAHLAQTVGDAFGDEPIHLVGYSVGGVVAGSFAYLTPDRVKSFVSVEGNFTLEDAFWSAKLARKPLDEVRRELEDPMAWLEDAGVDHPEPEWVETAARWLAHQPASTVHAMAQSVVRETGQPEYLAMLRSVFSRHPVRLVAGGLSRNKWNVPDWAISLAAKPELVEGRGHLMMIEDPDQFATRLEEVLLALEAVRSFRP